MVRGILIARAGMLAQQARAEVAAHNLANAATPGYRRKVGAVGAFQDLLLARLDPAGPGADPAPAPVGPLSFGPAVAAVAEDPAPPLPGGSNVEPGREMVELMTAVRAYEAGQRVLQALDDVLAQAVQLGRV